MTVYPYLEKTAINPVAPITIAKSATFSVYDLNDTGYLTPLNVTRLSDGATVTTLLSDSNGYIPDFTVIDRTSLVIHDSASGFSKTLVTSAPIAGATGATGTTGATGAKGDPGDIQEWAANTFYPLNQVIVNPAGDLVTVTTAHTSTTTYDATKFTLSATILGKVGKGELAFHVSDYGAVGDGVTDDTSAITNAATAAVAAGRLLVFNGTKRYRLTGAVTFTGLSLQTNNCTFVKSENNATYYIKIGDNIRADKLKLEIAGGVANDAGIYVNGSNISIDSIEVTTLTADQVGPNALLVGDLTLTNPAKTNIRIRHIALTGFRSPMRTINIDGCRFSNIKISNFSTAVYVIDTRNTVFDRAAITGTSASSTGIAGQNAMLMEAQSADYSCSNIRFEDWLSDGSPEHAFRIGGSLSVIDVTFLNCIAKNAGNAPGNVATGGAGFKALGVAGHHHKRVRYINCSAADSNTNASGINNFAQFHLAHCDNLSVINPSVTAVSNTYSAQVAMYIFSCNDVYVSNPNFQSTKTYALYIGADGADPSPVTNNNIQVAGGYISTASTTTQCILMDTLTSTTQNVFLRDIVCSAGSNAFRMNTPGTGGSFAGLIQLAVKYINAPTASTDPPIRGIVPLYLDYLGPMYGSFGVTASDGSIYLNTTNGQRFLRKAGAWAQQ